MTSVINLIRHYQRNIEKCADDEKRVLRCLDKLHQLGVTVHHLQETGVGRTVNALRKEPGEVGTAARALVAKWKHMVASAEDSSEEDDPHDHTNSGRDSPEDSDHRNESRDEDHSFESDQETGEHLTKSYNQTNGDHDQSAKRYHDRDDDGNRRKKSKYSEESSDEKEKPNIEDIQIKTEHSDSYEEDTEVCNEYTSDSSNDASQLIKLEPKYEAEREKSISKSSECADSTVHIGYTSRSNNSHSKNESQHSSEKDSRKPNEKSKHEKEKRREMEEKRKESRTSSQKRSTSDNTKPDQRESSPEKHRSSEKHKSSDKGKSTAGRHKSEKVSEKSHSKDKSNSSEKHSSSSEKHKGSNHKDKSKEESSSHNKKTSRDSENSSNSKDRSQDYQSSSSHKLKHEKRESSHIHSEKEDKEVNRTKDRSRSGESSSKSKYSDHSSSHSLKDKKEKSSSSNSKHKSSKNLTKDEKRSSDKPSSSTDHNNKASSSKSCNKNKDNVPKKKVKIQDEGPDSDDGIDYQSGASFAEALGMVSPVKGKKKSQSKGSGTTSPSNGPTASTSNGAFPVPTNLLAPSTKLAPLQPLEISALPEISPNYKPRPPPKLLPQANEEDALNYVMSTKNQRTKVFSGNKSYGKVLSLYELCVNVLQEHIDALEYTGGVPYEILKPVIDRATPDQLFVLEHYNAYLMEDTNHLWQKHCEKKFRNKQRQEMETWREMYMRCQEEQEARLKSLTANIKMAQDARNAPTKQTKMAYVDTVVKPPRNIARKQAIHGTARAAVTSPAARVASLAGANVVRAGTGAGPGRPSASALAPIPSSSSAFKPKKAPLMQKALQFMRGRKR